MKRHIHIHLWIFNHKFKHIVDFTETLIARFRQNGYVVTLGKEPRKDALNVVLESFSNDSRRIIREFYKETGKKVAVVMTENLEFIENRILMHKRPVWEDDGYMHPGTKVKRVVNLVALTPHIAMFITFRSMIDLSSLSLIFEEIPLCYIPYPEVEYVRNPPEPKHDLVFSGSGTGYRGVFLEHLKCQGLSVHHPGIWLSRNQMHSLYARAKIILSLPQSKTWNGFLSIMRFLSALRAGRAPLLLCEETENHSRQVVYVHKVDIRQPEFKTEMMTSITSYKELYNRTYERYQEVVHGNIQEQGWAHECFERWLNAES